MVNAHVSGIAIDCPNAEELCGFYTGLLGIERSAPDAFMIGGGNGHASVEVWFQEVENYVAPTWPTQERGQQMHFDLRTDDREAMIARAIELGATVADPNQGGSFTVMLDPAGHPFCLCDPD
jgi:catechol 2,3-dioxygenase-like lactoylglutathione lyase family enzyme